MEPKRCFRCEKTEREVRLVDAIYENEIVKKNFVKELKNLAFARPDFRITFFDCFVNSQI